MSQIRLKDTTTGALNNYPVMWIDMDKLQGFDPSLPLSQSTTDCAGAVQYATATYGATVDLDYYVLGDSVNGGYTSGYLDSCISGATKPDDRVSRRLVDLVRQSDGAAPDAGYPFNMLFQSGSYSTPPGDFNGTSYFSKQSYGGYTKYNIINSFSPGTYAKNEYISRKFVTTTGNTFGVCIGVGISVGICVGVGIGICVYVCICACIDTCVGIFICGCVSSLAFCVGACICVSVSIAAAGYNTENA